MQILDQDMEGKADNLCQLSGDFVVYGEFPSFSKWFFSFAAGELVDSYTDDLTAQEWPTTALVDGSQSVSLIQVTHASDAVITTTLYLEKTCIGGLASLGVIAAQTIEYDMCSGDHWVEGHVDVHSSSECGAHVVACREECDEEFQAGDDYYCFESCMDENAWPCPKLYDDGTSRMLSNNIAHVE